MRITKAQLENKAQELGIPLEDLNNQQCIKYLKTCIKTDQPKTQYEYEPRDASGFTDIEILYIHK